MNHVIQPAAIRKSLVVRASPETAFRVFTEGFDRWWPRSHSIGASPLKRAVIEPGAGGRWYGLLEDGTEAQWGDVLAWEPPGRVLLAWRITAQWSFDPDLLTEVEVRFTDLGGGETKVEFEHRHLERLGDATARAALESPAGWGALLERFKAEAEA